MLFPDPDLHASATVAIVTEHRRGNRREMYAYLVRAATLESA